MNEETVRERLRRTSLFANLGGSVEVDGVSRMVDWSDWPGPEDPAVQAALDPVNTYLEGMAALLGDDAVDRLLDAGVSYCKELVPYDEAGDAWDPRRTAVWHAAAAHLAELDFVQRGQEIPSILRAQLQWFERGHWPCALAKQPATDPLAYVVY